MVDVSPNPPGWIAIQATVTSCRYRSSALSSMAFGVGLEQKFLITFDYYAHGRLYSDQFGSARAIPQNEQVALAYTPLDPQENTLTHRASSTQGPSRSPLIAVGIAGSVILSLAWLLVLRGCRPG